MLVLKTVHVFCCGSNYGNYSVSFPSAGVVSAPKALLSLCSESVAWACLLLCLLEFQADFLCFVCFPLHSFCSFFCSAFFNLWQLHSIYCLHLLVLESSAVCWLLSVLWKVVLCSEKFWERKKWAGSLWGDVNKWLLVGFAGKWR